MTAEVKIIELLTWAKKRKLAPEGIRPDDVYLCPVTQKLFVGRALRAHQRRTALWIPNQRGLAQIGIRTKLKKVGHMVTMKAGPFEGAGVGEPEAALSMVNQIMKLAA